MAMSQRLSIVLTPAILFLSLPLIPLAVLTTAFALSILSLSALLVYVEVGGVLFSQELSRMLKPRAYPVRQPVHRERSSSVSPSGSVTPKCTKLHHTSSTVSLNRDFEGVGGWRIRSHDDEGDSVWLNMNSRLELPLTGHRTPEEKKGMQLRRRTSGSLGAEGDKSKRGSTRSRARNSLENGTFSPEEVYMLMGKTRSTIMLDTDSERASVEVNLGRMGRRRKSASSESNGSGKTVTVPG